MYRTLGVSRSGLHANQYKLDAISDEIANTNTHGYKKSEVSFQELMVDRDTSVGTKAGIHKTDFSQGNLTETFSKWDLAVEGDGFFRVIGDNGALFLKRDGNFQMNEDGRLVDRAGNVLDVEYLNNVDDFNPFDIEINKNGELQVLIEDESVVVGRISLFMPESIQELERLGDNLFTTREGSLVYNSTDNPELFGDIASGVLEHSNTDLTKSMSEMVVTQRAYSLNSQALKSTDDIMRLINEIKR